MNITGLWDQLVDCICRPPRDRYTTADLPGGVAGTFKLKGKEYLRKDVRLENSQKQHIECSHLVPKYPPETPDGKLPCVVYCHCNSGSRRDSEEALHLLLPQNVTVFSLDFVGSGQSDGKYVTLGWREQDDLALAIKHLRELGTVSTIGLWGRSMGAVTALLYSQKDPSIAGVVVDSPFSKLTELMLELVEEQKIPIPRSLMRVALSMMRRSVKKRAGFSIDEVAPIDKIHTSFIPVLFGHAREDTFVTKEHSEKLIAKYGSPDKELMLFDGDHNSVRPTKFYGKVLMFFHQALQCQGTLIPDEHNSGSYEVAMEAEAARAAEDMEPPALARTTSPNFSELMSDPSNAQQMQEDLAEELTSQMARRGPHGHADLPSQQHATDDLDELGSVPELSELRQEGQPSQMLTEEAALVRALHLSLLEVQHQEHGHVPGVGAAEPAAAASTALQDTVPQDMQSMAPEDAEEAMLAAAIRASLIEAGEPDTSVQSASATSSHQEAHAADRLEDWQQDSLLVPMPSSSVTRQSAGSLQDQQLLQGQRQQQNGLQQQDQQRWYHQHSQQQQQQQPGHHQQQDMPDGLGVTPGFAAAAYQFGGMAAELQGTAPSKGENQGSFQQGLEQARGMQMRPSWSSSALMQAEYEEAEPLVSAASTPVDGVRSVTTSFLCLFICFFFYLITYSCLCSLIKYMCAPSIKHMQPDLVLVWGPEGMIPARQCITTISVGIW
ncbi:TPA: hypothetical protein ACH3X2_008248 [Trebouxia sp. C0005]